MWCPFGGTSNLYPTAPPSKDVMEDPTSDVMKDGSFLQRGGGSRV